MAEIVDEGKDRQRNHDEQNLDNRIRDAQSIFSVCWKCERLIFRRAEIPVYYSMSDPSI